MSSQTLAYMSITQLSSLMQNLEVSPLEVVQTFLTRIEKYDSKINSFISIFAQESLNEAKRIEKLFLNKEIVSPMQGIPVALKDIIYTKDQLTTSGSRLFKDFYPSYDATVTTKLKNANAIILGKTALLEFAMGGTMSNEYFGSTYNPWNLKHFPGGSSSGSGASVAAGLVTCALGTDTGGSVRGPSHNCGIVGLKPTFGRVSRYGVVPLSWSLDHVGPMTRTVTDCILMLESIQGFDKKDPYSISMDSINIDINSSFNLQGKTIGVFTAFTQDILSKDVETNMKKMLEIFKSLGVNIIEFGLEELSKSDAQQGPILYDIIVGPESAAYHYSNMQTNLDEYGTHPRRRLEAGLHVLGHQYVNAQRQKRLLTEKFKMFFNKCDVIISPANFMAAPVLDDLIPAEDPVRNAIRRSFTSIFNLTGLPSLVVPIGFDSLGLPMGCQIVSNHYQENTIFEFALEYEKVADWNKHYLNVEENLSSS